MPNSAPDFLEILRILSDHKVEFIVVGGVCAVLHGAPVATFDLDLVHNRALDNLERLIYIHVENTAFNVGTTPKSWACKRTIRSS